MTTVIVAEKPSVALDIAKVVGATSRRDGYAESRDGAYRVTWALGHLVELAAPEEIQGEWRCWSVLPILPSRFPLVPRRDRAPRAQLAVVERLLKSRSTKVIVNAADAGREGELIFRYILEWVFDGRQCDKPIKRFWASSLTEDAIKEALAGMRSSSAYDRLANAAYLRSRLDWLVGINGTRALRAFGGRAGLPVGERRGLTVGRVQTPTLAMIVKLDAAIRDFEPKPFREVTATFTCRRTMSGVGTTSTEQEDAAVTATYVRLQEDAHGVPKWEARLWPGEGGRLLSPIDDAEEVRRRASTGTGRLRDIQRESRTYRPELLFDLTSLQREANVLWGWSASKTLGIAQELYERHKLLSYPRTDARHLSKAVAEQLPAIVRVVRVTHEPLLVPETGKAPLARRFVDDDKVSDHHAIIPTGREPSAGLTVASDAGKLYELVCRRLLGAWQPDCVEATSEISFEVEAEGLTDRYVVRGTEIVVPGWRLLEPKRKESDLPIPTGLKAGSTATVSEVAIMEKKTRPPNHFTEATLLSALESAGRSLQGEAADAMRERGLGTPATRASTIEGLVARGYVVREGRTLRSTPLGARLIASVDDALKSAELTGDMEARLRRIERGTETVASFASDVAKFVRALVAAHRPEVR